MKNSKKGMSLVELVICCAIIVMLGGACTAVLASGSSIFNQSSRTANAQLDSDVLQNYMIQLVPSAKRVGQIEKDDVATLGEEICFYFDEESGKFTIRTSADKSTTISSVTEFTYKVICAGEEGNNARAQLMYTAKFMDGSSMNSGFVLSNVKYGASISGDAKDTPLCLYKVAASDPATDPTEEPT